jgi:hypothetical protein
LFLKVSTAVLDVLGSGSQEELLAYELQPAEPEPMEADLAVTLQFCEERFDLLWLSLCLRELRCSSEISRSMSGCFVHVDCKIPDGPVVHWDSVRMSRTSYEFGCRRRCDSFRYVRHSSTAGLRDEMKLLLSG